jgi:hypothetical protein
MRSEKKRRSARSKSFLYKVRLISQFRKEKYEKLKQGGPKHQFADVDYLRKRDLLLDDVEDALEAGMFDFE